MLCLVTTFIGRLLYFLLLTLWSEFIDLRKLVVMFRLLRLSALPFYDLHRSTSLLSFAKVTVGIILYLIL